MSIGAVVVPSAPVHAQLPVPPIVYGQPNPKPELTGTGLLSFVNPDGSGIQPRPLDQHLVNPQGPVWSKDGQLLAAVAVPVGGGPQQDVFVFDPMGGGIRNATNIGATPFLPCGAATQPLVPRGEAFSRDGQSIVYTLTEQCTVPVTLQKISEWLLLVNNIATGQRTSIVGGGTWTADEGVGVDWSPTQDLVVVPQSFLDLTVTPPTSVTALYAGMPTAGNLLAFRQVTHPVGHFATLSFDLTPSISPDGLRVAFVRYVTPLVGPTTTSVITADIATGSETVLATLTNEVVTHVGWSPEETRLVFDRGALTVPIPDFGGLGLWVVSANGTGLSRIVQPRAWSPAWSPAPALERVSVLPALSNGAYGGYVTTAYVENLGQAPATVRIDYFGRSGTSVGAGDLITTLAPHGVWTVRQDNGHAFPQGGAGSAIIRSSQPVAAFVNEFAAGLSDASSYSAIPIPDGIGTSLYAPAIASKAYGGYTTGMGILNAGDAPTTVSITYRGPTGGTQATQTFTVAAHAYLDVYSGNAGGATDARLPDGFAGTALIQSSGGQPLAAVVNEVGPGGQFSSYDAVPGGSTTLRLPVALNGAYGGYHTGVGVQDVGGLGGTVSVSYYDQNGGVARTVGPLTLAVNGYLPIYQGDAALGPPVSGSGYTAVLTSTDPIAAIVNEVAPLVAGTTAQQSTSYNTFGAGLAAANLPLVESAGSDGWSTGLGIMNAGTTPATVTVAYFDVATGAGIGTAQSHTLQPNAFWGVYQPAAGLPAGTRASALVTSTGGPVAVICNEQNLTTFMSYSGQ